MEDEYRGEQRENIYESKEAIVQFTSCALK